MKTINGIITTILIVLLMVTGLNLIFTQAGSNVDLDDKSLNLLKLYNPQLNNITQLYNESYETARTKTEFDPNSNDQGDEIKDFFDHKTRVDQLRDTLSIAYLLPDLMMLSMPFVDFEDLTIYRNVTWFIIWLSIFIAIILALRNGIITEEQK